MPRLKTFLTVIGAVTILVLAANSAVYAATGGKFILGHTNKAGKVSTLKRTHNGPALNIVTKSSAYPPMTVNGAGKVTNLNADRVDSLDSSALRTHSYVYTKSVGVATGSVTLVLPMPAGTYLVSYSAFLIGGGTGNTFCQIRREHASTSSFVAISQFTSGVANPGLTGSGLVTKAAGDTVELDCSAANNFTTGTIPIQVVLTPTVVTGGAALRVAPGGARIAGR